jgi:hypothetical protein
MANLIEDWDRLREGLERSEAAGFALSLRVHNHDVSGFLAAARPGGSPAILIDLPLRAPRTGIAPFSTTALELLIGQFPGMPSDRFGVVLQLKDGSYLDLFAHLCADIFLAIESAHSLLGAVQSIARTIARWRRFIESNRRGLTEHEVRGLVGELVVLTRLFGSVGPEASLDAWKAPRGAIRDFELPNCTVEVKSYHAADGAALYINDPAQLEEVEERPLYLAAVRVTGAEAGRTLPELVLQMRTKLFAPAGLKERFDDAVAAYGYMAAQAAEYRTTYVAGPLILHRVIGGFPRITTAQVPLGVTAVRFAVPIGAITPFVCESIPVLGTSSATFENGVT